MKVWSRSPDALQRAGGITQWRPEFIFPEPVPYFSFFGSDVQLLVLAIHDLRGDFGKSLANTDSLLTVKQHVLQLSGIYLAGREARRVVRIGSDHGQLVYGQVIVILPDFVGRDLLHQCMAPRA